MNPWQQRNIVSLLGNSGFSSSTGTLTAESTGWYMMSLNVDYKKAFGSLNIAFMKGDRTGSTDLTSSCNVRCLFFILSSFDIEFPSNCQLEVWDFQAIPRNSSSVNMFPVSTMFVC